MGDEQRCLVDDGQQQMRHRPGVDDPDAAIAARPRRACTRSTPNPCCASIARHPSQPRTAGPSIRMIRRTSGSSDASRKAWSAWPSRSNQVSPVDRPAGLRTQVGLDIFEHGTEERFLVSEIVIQRAAVSDAGRLDDLVGARREVALLAEQPARRCKHPLASRLGLLLASTGHHRTVPGRSMASSGSGDSLLPVGGLPALDSRLPLP